MGDTKVQIGKDVILNIGIHSDWYISALSYDGKSINVNLYRKADRYKEWWLADTPQTEPKMCANCKHLKKHNGSLADWVCDRKGAIVTDPLIKECDEMWEQSEQTEREGE